MVRVPLNESTDSLADSYELAKSRFLSLERKLERSSEVKCVQRKSTTTALRVVFVEDAKTNTGKSFNFVVDRTFVIKRLGILLRFRQFAFLALKKCTGKF